MLEQLLDDPSTRPIALLDAAVNPALLDRLYEVPGLSFDCFAEGETDAERFHSSPFAVDLTGQPELLAWLERGWGRSWGVYGTTRLSLDQLVRRLRPLTVARMPERALAEFRFHDPRVLRAALPVLEPAQQRALLDPFSGLVCEALRPDRALRFAWSDAGLVRDAVPFGH